MQVMCAGKVDHSTNQKRSNCSAPTTEHYRREDGAGQWKNMSPTSWRHALAASTDNPPFEICWLPNGSRAVGNHEVFSEKHLTVDEALVCIRALHGQSSLPSVTPQFVDTIRSTTWFHRCPSPCGMQNVPSKYFAKLLGCRRLRSTHWA